MRAKTKEEKLWSYLSKKLGKTKLAKEVFSRVTKYYKSPVKEIVIEYKVDSKPLMDGLKLIKAFNAEMKKVRIRK